MSSCYYWHIACCSQTLSWKYRKPTKLSSWSYTTKQVPFEPPKLSVHTGVQFAISFCQSPVPVGGHYSLTNFAVSHILKMTNRWVGPYAIYITNINTIIETYKVDFLIFVLQFCMFADLFSEHIAIVQGTALAGCTVLLYFCTSRQLASHSRGCSRYLSRRIRMLHFTPGTSWKY